MLLIQRTNERAGTAHRCQYTPDLGKGVAVEAEPVASRPWMPGYGIDVDDAGLLPWGWAMERLERAQHYWVATTSPDGGPHLAAVWGVWADGALCFSTGGASVKARNLAADPRCSVSAETAEESVVVQGTAQRLTGDTAALMATYQRKYGMGFPDPAENPVFRVAPRMVIGVHTPDFASSATRWTFPDA